MSSLASVASGLSTETIAALLKPMNATTIIETLTTLATAGVNISSFDTPAIISELNTTQITGLLQSNSTTVTGLLQSLQPTQLVTLIYGFQNTTSLMFDTAAATNNTALATEATTLVTLLVSKLQTTFTDSQLLGLFKILGNGAAYGTGSKVLLKKATALISGFFGSVSSGISVSIPTRLLKLVEDYQPAIFGNYPVSGDVAPSAIFTAIFAIFTIVYTLLFLKNWSLGHKFFITLGLAFYSLIRTIGFILRIVWAKNLTKLGVGLASTIFLVICTAFLPSLNLILAQRYFTWKHPIYGSSKLFMALMYIIYSFVIGVVSMTIVAACVQIDYLLSESNFKMTKQVIEASSVLILIYSLIAVVLVFGASFIPSTSKDKQVLTYQPTWVKSFAWNYFVPSGAAKQEGSTISEEQKHAVRVIQSTDYHYGTVNGEQQHESKLHHGGSIIIITISTLLLFISDVFRCISTFLDQYHKDQSWIYDKTVMYVMFGALETLINLLFIFGRIDLRFYKPDSFKTVLPTVTDHTHAATEKEVENASPVQSSVEDAESTKEIAPADTTESVDEEKK